MTNKNPPRRNGQDGHTEYINNGTTACWARKTPILICILSTLFITLWIAYTNQVEKRDVIFEPLPRHENRTTCSGPSDDVAVTYLTEEKALTFKRCKHFKLAADAARSKMVEIGNNKSVYHIGDTIRIYITLFNGYGTPKTTGGDDLRASIARKDVSAHAPGVIRDHENGSYTVEFEALWTGTSYITVTLAHVREEITPLYRVKLNMLTLHVIQGKFKTPEGQEEIVPCEATYDNLKRYTNYQNICNLTAYNSDMPWYCAKPRNTNISCSDFSMIRAFSSPPLPISPCEKILLSRGQKMIGAKITVSVNESLDQTKQKYTRDEKPPCVNYNTTKLWYKRSPTGYFLKESWVPRHCKGITSSAHLTCLRNKIIYLMGDSTVRQWYENMYNRFRCKGSIGTEVKGVNHTPLSCRNIKYNFTIKYFLHNQPFYLGNRWAPASFTSVSIARRLDDIKSDENASVLFHIYLHMIKPRHTVYRRNIERIRDSVEGLLRRNKKVKVFIKAPHTFNERYFQYRLSDYFRYVMTDILFEAFQNFQDKVIFLDQKDATIAVRSQNMHPAEFVVTGMVNQMLSYMCSEE